VAGSTTEGRDRRTRSTRDGMRATAKSYARGCGGALLVGTPLLYTMEMWWSGFVLPPHRALVFYLASFVVLVALEHYSGFRDEGSLLEEVIDAVEALGIGTVVAAILLAVTGVFDRGLSILAVLGMIVLESVPLAVGASVAISLLGGRMDGEDAEEAQRAERERREAGFWGTQTIGVAGALYFGFNVAPTEEPMLIGLRMTSWQTVLLLLLSLLVVHAMLYAVDFRGGERLPHGHGWWRSLVGLGSVGYASAALVALFLLWVFGRIDGDTGPLAALQMTVALAFVTSLGAAAGRLII
jgi:putative integral membrane protein (TIGR02587 family)